MTDWSVGCYLGGRDPNGPMPTILDVGFKAITSGMSITSGLETNINWTSKSQESPVGVFNLATDLFTAPVDGRYVFTSSLELVLGARGACYNRFYISGTYIGSASDETSIAGTVTPTMSCVTWMTAGQTAQIRIFQNSGFAGSLIGCCNQSFFSGSLIYTP